MIETYDDFLPAPERVRASALASGFGTWRPHKGDMGAESYGGVNFVGDHATPLRELEKRLQRHLMPNSMFFRITNPTMERALIHSDREYGEYTAILYLSPHSPEFSGTAFYRHRRTGITEMPALEELLADPPFFQEIHRQMLAADDADWECYKTIAARYNRMVFFSGPLIHCRIPKTGFGETEADSRMVWVAHLRNSP